MLILMISFSLISCQNTWDIFDSEDQPTNIIGVTEVDPRAGMATLLDDFTLDIDKDGSEEKIELYTAAERDKNGEIMWDDGQNWLLVVVDGNEYYPLLNQYVQLGVVYFTVWEDEDKLQITVIINTGANQNIANYTYNKEKNVFTEELIFDTGGVNAMYSSIPWYQ